LNASRSNAHRWIGRKGVVADRGHLNG
jgi:hypothetical protein